MRLCSSVIPYRCLECIGWRDRSIDVYLGRYWKAGRRAVLHQGCMDIIDFPYLDEDKKGGQQSLI